MSTITHWWWIRHAPSIGDQGIIHGQDGVGANLSDTEAIKRLRNRLPKDALWFSSDIRRTIETATALSDGIEPIQITEFAEQSFGLWNGQKWKDLPKKNMDRFWTNYGDQKAPEGESFRELVDRVASKIKSMSSKYLDRDLIVVAHAGTIRAALTLALDLPLNSALYISISNLSLTKIDAFSKDSPFSWRVEFANLPINIK